jgi:hypothetical protein
MASIGLAIPAMASIGLTIPAMASIGLTIPAIAIASIWLEGPLLRGWGPRRRSCSP